MEPNHASHFDYAHHVPTFDASRKHAGITLSGGNRTATATTGGAHQAVYCTRGFAAGQHYWCVEVTDRGPNAYVMIGVSAAGATQTHCNHYPGIAGGASGVSLNLHTACRFYSGTHVGVIPHGRDAALVRNARYIGVLLDVDARRVMFFADGVCLGVCAGPDVIVADTTWYPVVTLYEAGSSVAVAALPEPRPASGLSAFNRKAPLPAAVADAYVSGGAPVHLHSAPLLRPAAKVDSSIAVRGPEGGGAVMQVAPGDSRKPFIGADEGVSAGLHYWSFTIPFSGVNGHVMIGVAGNDFEQHAADALQPGNKSGTGVVLYLFNANRYHENTQTDMGLGAAVKRSTRVGMLLDMDRRTVTAFADGVLVGTIAEETNVLLRGAAYRPAVCLYQMGQIVVPDVLTAPPRPRVDPSTTSAAEAGLPACALPDALRWEQLPVAHRRPRFSIFRIAPGLSMRFAYRAVEHVRAAAGWLTAVADTALPPSGVSYFSCRVLNRGSAGNIAIGLVAGSARRRDGPVAGCVSGATQPGTAACAGVGVKLADGTATTVPHGRKALPGGEALKQAWHVGIALDMSRRVAQVYADGMLVAVCAGPDVLTEDRYYPCVACHDPSASVAFDAVA